MRDDVGARLAERRRALGLSQRELGRRSGVYYSDISRLERGEQRGASHVRRLAVALGLDPETLEVVEDIAPARPRYDVERAMELVATALPGVVIERLVADLFPGEHWSPGGREEAMALIRAEWERASGWTSRVRDAYAAAQAPMAASAGVPSGEAEEKVFLRRMRHALERGGRA